MTTSITQQITPMLPPYHHILEGSLRNNFVNLPASVTLEKRSSAVSAGRRYASGNSALRISLAQHPATKRAQSTSGRNYDSFPGDITPTSGYSFSFLYNCNIYLLLYVFVNTIFNQFIYII